MTITSQVPQYFFAILVIVTFNMCNIRAMEPASMIAEVEQKMSQCLNLMLHLEDEKLLVRDVSNHVWLELFYQHLLPTISYYLKVHKANPKAVLVLIQQLHEAYGPDLSVKLLKMALANKGKTLCDIQDQRQKTCLHFICGNTFSYAHYQDYIKIIFCAAGYDAWNLVFMKDRSGWLPLHYAVRNGCEDVVNMFIDWAVRHNMLEWLLFTETNKKTSVLHLAAFNGNIAIFRTLLEQADRFGKALTFASLRDKRGRTPLNFVEQYFSGEVYQEIQEIIEFYHARYELESMSLLEQLGL